MSTMQQPELAVTVTDVAAVEVKKFMDQGCQTCHNGPALGGSIQTNTRVTSLDIAGDANAVLFDVTPKQFLEIAGDEALAEERGVERRAARRSPLPTAWPTVTAAAAPTASGTMNVSDARLIATWCAASSTVPMRPMSSAMTPNAAASSSVACPLRSMNCASMPTTRPSRRSTSRC